MSVSIHAPAWGATHAYHNVVLASDVSIHAPAWGATTITKFFTDIDASFNPRTRMGCDYKSVS